MNEIVLYPDRDEAWVLRRAFTSHQNGLTQKIVGHQGETWIVNGLQRQYSEIVRLDEQFRGKWNIRTDKQSQGDELLASLRNYSRTTQSNPDLDRERRTTDKIIMNVRWQLRKK